MNAKDFDHIPYNELNPEQQEARKASRAPLVEAAKQVSKQIDYETYGTVRGLNILKEEDADGWIAGQVWDKSEVSRLIILSHLHSITLHFLGLSDVAKADRASINEFLAKDGQAPLVEPVFSISQFDEEAAIMYDMIALGKIEEYGVRCEADEDHTFILNLVRKDVVWDNDEMVQIIKLDDPDFNLIIDYIS